MASSLVSLIFFIHSIHWRIQGRDPGGPGPPFCRLGPALYQGLDDRPPGGGGGGGGVWFTTPNPPPPPLLSAYLKICSPTAIWKRIYTTHWLFEGATKQECSSVIVKTFITTFLSPKIDQHHFSPNTFNIQSREQVMSFNKIIT